MRMIRERITQTSRSKLSFRSIVDSASHALSSLPVHGKRDVALCAVPLDEISGSNCSQRS
jgi:hypothetical protein